MITIQKGNHTLQVSKDTYKTMFKRMGYIVVDNKEEVKKETSPKNNNTKKDSENKKESIKESKDEKEVSKNDLEDILGMLSEKDNKKENRQTKNKEEK